MSDPLNGKPYVPVSCDIFDALLEMATSRVTGELGVVTLSGDREYKQGVVIDVFASGGVEYVEFGDGTVFRLDQISAVNGKPVI